MMIGACALIFLLSLTSVKSFNVLHFFANSLNIPSTKARSVIKVDLSVVTQQCTDPLFDQDRLFKQDPSMRKIAKKYLQKKIFCSDYDCYGDCRINTNNHEICYFTQKISGILPRVDKNDIQVLAVEICQGFQSDNRPSITDVEFVDAILSSPQFREVGDLFFKEIAYMDCLSQNGCSLLSDQCLDSLKVSLVEESSPVTELTPFEAKIVLQKLSILNEKGIGSKLFSGISILEAVL